MQSGSISRLEKYSVVFLPAHVTKIRKPTIGQVDARTNQAQAVLSSILSISKRTKCL